MVPAIPPQLRDLEPIDAAEIFRIMQESEATGGPPTGPHWSETQVREECGQGQGWVAVSGLNQIQAFILCRDVGSAWEISFLATSPAARGHGLMRLLIKHMMQDLPVGREIWLEVHELNLPARQLYEKSGFRRTGQRSRYYSDGGSAVLYSYGPVERPHGL